MHTPQLLWDLGTAYDLFMSLVVLHEPADFGARGAWTAGVRARIPEGKREILEQSLELGYVPMHWIHTLPDPKDAITVLSALGQISPIERLPVLALGPDEPEQTAEVLRKVAARQTWGDEEREALRQARTCEGKPPPSSKKLESILNWWSRAEEFGVRYLEALRAYHEVFFAEEERRIQPVLKSALARAQEMAGQLAFPDLLEELSQGLRFSEPPDVAELVLVPSYWSTPLVVMSKASPERALWLFGARPPDASLVPGEVVPDAMLRALKALSDPTRLRIMRYLSIEPLTPAELARRLRLRAPTVTHHLRSLRLAGLVRLTVGESKDDRRYAARPEAIATTCASLDTFLVEHVIADDTKPED
ncbi:ArsR/SmtB family transcription factor [Chloroflexota bacterium]